MATSTMTPDVLGRPPAVDVGLLVIAVTAVSTSGPIIAAIAAPAIAISFWRCFLGAGVTAPFAILRRRGAAVATSRRDWRLMASAGAVLAMHFATWVPSLRFTSVASATALVATQPIWVAFIAARRGAHIPRRAWIGIAVAFTGVVVITGVDFAVSPAALVGDGLALLGGALAAVYISVGEEARQAVSTSVYTSTVYAVAAMALILIALVGRIPLVGFSVRDWTLILLLTAGAQLLGHTLVNRVIETTSATVVSLAILLEVPGAIVIASWWLGQTPPLSIIPAVALLFAGLTLVIASGDRRTPSETPPV